ncbi:hypothetical protein SESBI_46257 [Sesbania bispinosa]|nr:hypothetical protein SESBI_46257 [Sesbania bispinosa]
MIPTFDGKEAYWWLINVEQYCDTMGISDEMKISRAVETMRGQALDLWFCWRWSNQNATWWVFVKAVLKQFQPEYDPDLLTASSGDEEQESDLEFETLMPLEESQEPVASRTGTDKENEQELREPETTQEGQNKR